MTMSNSSKGKDHVVPYVLSRAIPDINVLTMQECKDKWYTRTMKESRRIL